jgi:hypothetical protein
MNQTATDMQTWEELIVSRVRASKIVNEITQGEVAFDATNLTAASECKLKGIYQVVLNRWGTRSLGPLAFGQAVHSGYECLLRGGSAKETIDAAHEEGVKAGLEQSGDEKRNFQMLKIVMNDIILDHKISSDRLQPVTMNGQLMVEMPFKLPLGLIVIKGETKDFEVKVNWQGKIDLISSFKDDGLMWPVDHKTTTAFGPKFLDTYIRGYQFLGYVWANSMLNQVFAHEPRGIAVNVIAMRKSGNEIKRLKVPYAAWKVTEWATQTLQEIQDYCQHLYDVAYCNGPLRINRPSCTTKFGRCAYFDLCDYHPKMRQRIFDDNNYYAIHEWSPFKQ